VLTTDTTLKVKASRAALKYSLTNELTYTVTIENLEWVVLDDVLLEIYWEELSDIVTRETECHLSKVVSTE
jgi:hypothetical protein